MSPGCSLARRGAHRSIAMAHCRSATRVLHWLLEVPRELSSTGQRQLHHHHHHHHFTGIDQPVPSSPSHLLSHWDAALGSWGPGRGMARARGLVPAAHRGPGLGDRWGHMGPGAQGLGASGRRALPRHPKGLNNSTLNSATAIPCGRWLCPHCGQEGTWEDLCGMTHSRSGGSGGPNSRPIRDQIDPSTPVTVPKWAPVARGEAPAHQGSDFVTGEPARRAGGLPDASPFCSGFRKASWTPWSATGARARRERHFFRTTFARRRFVESCWRGMSRLRPPASAKKDGQPAEERKATKTRISKTLMRTSCFFADRACMFDRIRVQHLWEQKARRFFEELRKVREQLQQRVTARPSGISYPTMHVGEGLSLTACQRPSAPTQLSKLIKRLHVN